MTQTGGFIGDRIRPHPRRHAGSQHRRRTTVAGRGRTVGPPSRGRHRPDRATAANIDPSWSEPTAGVVHHPAGGRRVAGAGSAPEFTVLNDADAAGIAEVAFGDPKATSGSVLLLTFGTGIGSALLHDGELFPNTELGHLLFPAMDAEDWASAAVRTREDLTYREWAGRVDRVLHEYVRILNPTTIIVGGGISRKHEKWVPKLTVDVTVVPAKLRNRAGIIGAALAVRDGVRP